ncbi:MAG: cyclic nucleotide-binding domain-containing protein [Anaerolineae bacterium]
MVTVSYLKQAGVFQDMTPTQLQLIASISSERKFHAGDIIFEERSNGTELYVIARGSVAIQINTGNPGEGEPQTIAMLGAGQSFGEVALVDSGLRSARALSAEANTLLVVTERDRLNKLCENYPALGYKLMRNLAADLAMKIRTTDSQMSSLLAQLRSTP